jgi:hypothetical protein
LGRGDQWSLFINLPVLEAATAGLSNCNLLGGGGFGPMYKASSNCSSPPLPLSCALRIASEHLVVQGVLESGQEIALKKLSLELRQGTREFLNGSTAILFPSSAGAGAGHKMLVYPSKPTSSKVRPSLHPRATSFPFRSSGFALPSIYLVMNCRY